MLLQSVLEKGRIEQIDRMSSGWVQKRCNLTAESMQIGCKNAAKRLQIGCKTPAQGRCRDCQIKLKLFYTSKQPAHLSTIAHAHEQRDHSSIQSGIDVAAKSAHQESSTVEHQPATLINP